MKFKKQTLKNGLRIIMVPRPESIATNVLVLAETGSKYESEKQRGLSHFLEHMFFKGTARRPKSVDISAELDGLGAEYNAYTSQEFTGYYATVQPKLALRALDIIADMYLHSTFPAAEIAKESGVIVEEINMYEDMPQRHVQDLFLSLLYGDTPAGRPIIGTKASVRSFKRDDFTNYRRHHYVAAATVVIVAGHFDEAKMLKNIKQQFADIPTTVNSPKVVVKEKQQKPAALVKFKQSDQTHLVLGFRAFSARHKQSEATDLLAAVLGGGMSSRLFQKIRDELGAAYYVRAYNDGYTDHGFLQVAVGTDNKRVKEIIKAILAEARKLKTTLVPRSELERVKESVIGHLFLGLERSSSLAGFYGAEEIIKGQLLTPEAAARRLRAVTARQLKAVAQKVFTNRGLNLALIGPFKDKSAFVPSLHL